jgi:hypothetical protein
MANIPIGDFSFVGDEEKQDTMTMSFMSINMIKSPTEYWSEGEAPNNENNPDTRPEGWAWDAIRAGFSRTDIRDEETQRGTTFLSLTISSLESVPLGFQMIRYIANNGWGRYVEAFQQGQFNVIETGIVEQNAGKRRYKPSRKNSKRLRKPQRKYRKTLRSIHIS